MQGIITFRSITPAQRGMHVLKNHKINCDLRRTPGELEDRGCGYCLYLSEDQMHRGIHVLKENRVPFGNAFRRVLDKWESL